MLNLNDFDKEFSVFNDGNAGIVEKVKIRVEMKGPEDPDNYPKYKLIASDGKGEINEGFFVQTDEEKFGKFQAQKLLNLYRGVVLGKTDGKIDLVFNTPEEALDVIMREVAKASKGRQFKVAVTYDRNGFLRFKSFGPFILPESSDEQLTFSSRDLLEKPKKEMTSQEEVKKMISTNKTSSVKDSDKSDDLPF